MIDIMEINELLNPRLLLSKPAILNRVKRTELLPANKAFAITDWQQEDNALPITWQIRDTLVGEAFIAATAKGICFLGFTNNDTDFALADLQRRFPAGKLIEEESELLNEGFAYLNQPKLNLPVHLHLKGTPFQLAVWKKLALIPFGGIATYAALAGSTRNARATGTAVGANPVSYILPCHRAVRSDGSFDRYYWGNNIKRQLLAYEDGLKFEQ
jgi:AraC family transcriptional regulator of adaptative response/methylated-DNA-[protein]-cysteine methyltransferase